MSLFTLDPKVMQKTGQIVFTTDLAAEYGFHDIDGNFTHHKFNTSIISISDLRTYIQFHTPKDFTQFSTTLFIKLRINFKVTFC